MVAATGFAPLTRTAQAANPMAPGFGLRIDLTSGDNTRALLNAAQVMRTEWIAQDIRWKEIEPQPGQYQWADLDNLVLSTRPYGFRVLFSVAGAPDWSRPAESDLRFDGPPSDAALYAGFLSTLAARYAGVVAAYEIWPEANLRTRWWTAEGVSPERYTDFLRQASRAVHAADPMAIVVSGGLAPTGSNDGFSVIDDLAFYQRMYAAGVSSAVDALGVRVNGHNNPPADVPGSSTVSTITFKDHTSFYFRHYEAVRQIMEANGDQDKFIWITSAGWASTTKPLAGMEYASDVSEDQQADYLVEALVQAQSQTYLATIIVNNLNLGTVPGGSADLAAYSILRPDWTARPAFVTIAQIRQGNAFAKQITTTLEPAPRHILPNWRPRLRYTFQSGQP
jgi:hypothetical protein